MGCSSKLQSDGWLRRFDRERLRMEDIMIAHGWIFAERSCPRYQFPTPQMVSRDQQGETQREVQLGGL
jgi:hypothetical protein